MSVPPLDPRQQRLLAGLDLARDRGLEIGPLDSPIVPKQGTRVLYVDHATTEDLTKKYDGDPNVGDIVTVDAVWGDNRLEDALRDHLQSAGPLRYAVASHVIEHVPDVVGWLQQIAHVLEPGGTLRLAIPDKRYCFDVHRTPTDVGALVAAHLEGRTRPPAAAVFDFWSRYTHVDAAALWAGEEPPPIGPGQDPFALGKATEAFGAADYHDVHCWVFTPASFLEVVDRLAGLDLLSFALQDLVPTAPGGIELFAVLERLPDGLAPEARRARQRDAVERFRALADASEHAVPVSAAELRALRAKREVARVVRGGWRRLRATR